MRSMADEAQELRSRLTAGADQTIAAIMSSDEAVACWLKFNSEVDALCAHLLDAGIERDVLVSTVTGAVAARSARAAREADPA